MIGWPEESSSAGPPENTSMMGKSNEDSSWKPFVRGNYSNITYFMVIETLSRPQPDRPWHVSGGSMDLDAPPNAKRVCLLEHPQGSSLEATLHRTTNRNLLMGNYLIMRFVEGPACQPYRRAFLSLEYRPTASLIGERGSCPSFLPISSCLMKTQPSQAQTRIQT